MKISITIEVEQTVIGAPGQIRFLHAPDMPPLQGLALCIDAQRYFLEAETLNREARKNATRSVVVGADGKRILNGGVQ